MVWTPIRPRTRKLAGSYRLAPLYLVRYNAFVRVTHLLDNQILPSYLTGTLKYLELDPKSLYSGTLRSFNPPLCIY